MFKGTRVVLAGLVVLGATSAFAQANAHPPAIKLGVYHGTVRLEVHASPAPSSGTPGATGNFVGTASLSVNKGARAGCGTPDCYGGILHLNAMDGSFADFYGQVSQGCSIPPKTSVSLTSTKTSESYTRFSAPWVIPTSATYLSTYWPRFGLTLTCTSTNPDGSTSTYPFTITMDFSPVSMYATRPINLAHVGGPHMFASKPEAGEGAVTGSMVITFNTAPTH